MNKIVHMLEHKASGQFFLYTSKKKAMDKLKIFGLGWYYSEVVVY